MKSRAASAPSPKCATSTALRNARRLAAAVPIAAAAVGYLLVLDVANRNTTRPPFWGAAELQAQFMGLGIGEDPCPRSPPPSPPVPPPGPPALPSPPSVRPRSLWSGAAGGVARGSLQRRGPSTLRVASPNGIGLSGGCSSTLCGRGSLSSNHAKGTPPCCLSYFKHSYNSRLRWMLASTMISMTTRSAARHTPIISFGPPAWSLSSTPRCAVAGSKRAGGGTGRYHSVC